MLRITRLISELCNFYKKDMVNLNYTFFCSFSSSFISFLFLLASTLSLFHFSYFYRLSFHFLSLSRIFSPVPSFPYLLLISPHFLQLQLCLQFPSLFHLLSWFHMFPFFFFSLSVKDFLCYVATTSTCDWWIHFYYVYGVNSNTFVILWSKMIYEEQAI